MLRTVIKHFVVKCSGKFEDLRMSIFILYTSSNLKLQNRCKPLNHITQLVFRHNFSSINGKSLWNLVEKSSGCYNELRWVNNIFQWVFKKFGLDDEKVANSTMNNFISVNNLAKTWSEKWFEFDFSHGLRHAK